MIETVWRLLNKIAQLFRRDKSVISRHFKNILESKDLVRNSVVAKNPTTADDGKTYEVEYFNLDAIISVGFRVNSRYQISPSCFQVRYFNDHFSNILSIKVIEEIERLFPVSLVQLLHQNT